MPQGQGDADNSIGKAGSSNTNSQPSTQHNPLGGRVASAATTGCAPYPMGVPSHTFRGSAVWAAMCQFTHYYMQLHVNSETALTKESQYGEPHSPYWDFSLVPKHIIAHLVEPYVVPLLDSGCHKWSKCKNGHIKATQQLHLRSHGKVFRAGPIFCGKSGKKFPV